MQGGLQPNGRAVLDRAPDRASLLLGRGQEPTAQHLLSADKRINLVTNNGAIKPFIWLTFCCQLLSKSSALMRLAVATSAACPAPPSSPADAAGGRSRFGGGGDGAKMFIAFAPEWRRLGWRVGVLLGAAPLLAVGRQMEEVPIPQNGHTVAPFLITGLEPAVSPCRQHS